MVEGSWEELMAIAKACHMAIRKKTDRALILIRLDDYGDRTDLLATTIAHIEQQLDGQYGRKLINSDHPIVVAACSEVWDTSSPAGSFCDFCVPQRYDRFIDSGCPSFETGCYGTGWNP